ncbi:MAG: ABC transporter permease [Lachnospiraceae bacterium]|nr:ABC transporter permease [Lachnospiraceae bacterium]
MKFIIKKTGSLIITLVIISFLSFLAFSLIPGDAAVASLGMDATEADINALREELGLNRPVHVQYADWLLSALQGDFGVSTQYHLPVSELVVKRLPATITLAVYSMVIIILVSFPAGLLGTRKPNGAMDTVMTVLSQVGMAVPQFFLGILLTFFFGIVLDWFTVGGYVGVQENPAGFFRFLVLPAVAVAVPKCATMTRYIRNAVVAQKKQDYVRTARGKGNSEKRVLLQHVLVNVMMPVVTMLAMMAADVLAGSIVVEQVFNIPGLGRLLITSISNRDYPVVQAIVVYMACAVVIMNTLADIAYQKLDPRVR